MTSWSVTRPSPGLARPQATAYDAAIVDGMLPEMDGFALCREIRKVSDIPVVMLTARGDVMPAHAGLAAGPDRRGLPLCAPPVASAGRHSDRGVFDAPIPLRRRGELGDLAQHINTMAHDIEAMLDAKRAGERESIALLRDLVAQAHDARLEVQNAEPGLRIQVLFN